MIKIEITIVIKRTGASGDRRRILEERASDGSSMHISYVPRTEPGQWRRTPPFFRPPELPQWAAKRHCESRVSDTTVTEVRGCAAASGNDAIPSATDRAAIGKIGEIWIICAGDETRAWLAKTAASFAEITLMPNHIACATS